MKTGGFQVQPRFYSKGRLLKRGQEALKSQLENTLLAGVSFWKVFQHVRSHLRLLYFACRLVYFPEGYGKCKRLEAEVSLGKVNKPTTRKTRDANDFLHTSFILVEEVNTSTTRNTRNANDFLHVKRLDNEETSASRITGKSVSSFEFIALCWKMFRLKPGQQC